MKQPAVYIMASQRNGTLYVGVTANLPQRAFQHREGLTPGFTRRYHCKMLVYYEMYEDMDSAIAREKAAEGRIPSQEIAVDRQVQSAMAGSLRGLRVNRRVIANIALPSWRA